MLFVLKRCPLFIAPAGKFVKVGLFGKPLAMPLTQTGLFGKPFVPPTPEELARQAAAEAANSGEPPKKRSRQPRPSPQQLTSANAKAVAKGKGKGRGKRSRAPSEPTAADAAHMHPAEDAGPAAAASEGGAEGDGKGRISWRSPVVAELFSASPAAAVAAEQSEPRRSALRRSNAIAVPGPSVEAEPVDDDSTEDLPGSLGVGSLSMGDVAHALGMDPPSPIEPTSPPRMAGAASSRDVFWSRDPRESAIILPTPAQSIVPYCHLCKEEVDPLHKGTRLLTKGAPHFRCATCQCKCSTLSTMFGGWPIEHYRDMPEADQTDFWKRSTTSKENLKHCVEKMVVYKQIKQRWEQSQGDYLPLGVYAARGYTNLKEIERNCPKEWNNKLGEWTYKLMVRGSGEKNLEELARETMHKLLSKAGQMKKPAEEKTAAAAATAAEISPEREPEPDDKGEESNDEEDELPTTQESAATTATTGTSNSSSDDESDKKKKKKKASKSSEKKVKKLAKLMKKLKKNGGAGKIDKKTS